jgi:hypothetical protein
MSNRAHISNLVGGRGTEEPTVIQRTAFVEHDRTQDARFCSPNLDLAGGLTCSSGGRGVACCKHAICSREAIPPIMIATLKCAVVSMQRMLNVGFTQQSCFPR